MDNLIKIKNKNYKRWWDKDNNSKKKEKKERDKDKGFFPLKKKKNQLNVKALLKKT